MMDIKKLAGILILLFIFMMGCAVDTGNYGNVSKQIGTEDKITLTDLRDNWNEYDVYYGKRSIRWADAIMFDPKNNGTELTGDSWFKIEDQETLDAHIEDIQNLYSYAGVYLIEGADNRVFGYMYYPYYLRVPVKVVDERRFM
jgi:hypothetical protein